MTVNYDFESGIPAAFVNDSDNPWVTTSAAAQSGSNSAKPPTIGNLEYSSLLLFGDFEAGDVTFYHQADSEGSFDVGIFRVDDASTVAASWSGTPGSFTLVTVAISAGVHCLQWSYEKDVSGAGGNDTCYIDNITVPDFTAVDLSDAETFSGSLPTGWTNDTGGEAWTFPTSRGVFSGNSARSASGVSIDSQLSVSSDSGAGAGDAICVYRVSSEPGFDFGQVEIDTSVVSQNAGWYGFNIPDCYGLYVSIDAVSSGSRDYDFRYTADSGTSSGDDRMDVQMFYEPGMTTAGGAGLSVSLAGRGGLAGPGGLAGVGGGLVG